MRWLTRLITRGRLERDLDREMRFHVDSRTADLMATGVPADEARRRALAEFGGLEPIREATRDTWGFGWLTDLAQDVKYALRMLRANPGFTLAAVLSLGLGIGANAAVFRVINALVLRPLDVARPAELVILEGRNAGESRFSHPVYQELAAAAPSAVVGAMTRPRDMQVDAGRGPELVTTGLVSRTWFDVLAVDAQLGRLFTADEERAAAPVAVVSDAYWVSRFDRRPSVIGASVLVNNAPRTIVGVLPAGFTGAHVGLATAVWLPLTAQHDIHYNANASMDNADSAAPWVPQPGIAWLALIGRLPASGADAAKAALIGRYRQLVEARALQAEDPARRERIRRDTLLVTSGARGFSDTRDQATPALAVLMAMVALVLVVACANLANLLLARGAARTREFALRLSIGARRGRLVRQLLAESLTLSGLGALVGLVVAWRGGAALLALMASGRTPPSVPLPADWRVVGFGIAITMLTGLGFGLMPAIRLSRPGLIDTIKSGARIAGGDRRGRFALLKSLVGVQVAVAMLLATGALLFHQTFRNYMAIDPGFDRTSVLNVRFDSRLAGYRPDELPGLYTRLTDEARRIPGVTAAVLGRVGPATGSASTSTVSVAGFSPAPGEDVLIHEDSVGPGFLATLGMRLVAGRDIGPEDTARTRRVAVVNETFVRLYLTGRPAVGAHFGEDSPNDVEIVGVVADARANGLRQAAPAMAYYALAQLPSDYARNLYVRVSGDPATVRDALRAAVRAAAPGLAVREVVTLGELNERTVGSERFVSDLTAIFGVVGVLVACLGLYGTIAYSVARRAHEIGVRLALGATPAGVRWMVVQETLWLVAAGVAAGVAVMLPLGQLLGSVVYGLSGRDPLTLVTASAGVLLVGCAAGLWPAWRASRVDPTTALRAE